jgi:hypothetical protein
MKIAKTLFWLALLTAPAYAAVDQKVELYDSSGGLMDRVSDERMPTKYTPNSRNVVLDKDMGLVMRPEYNKFNTSALPGTPAIMNLYNFNTDDGSAYLMVNCSSCVYQTKDNSTYTSINSTFTLNKRQTFETALGKLWGGNGVENEWMWNQTTFTDYTINNSTNMVKAKYHIWHGNRMWRAGVTNYPLFVYYSRIRTTAAGAPDPDPADLGNGTLYEYIPQNGESVTGFARLDGYLFIFTENSTWQFIGDPEEGGRLVCINPFIGCLYDSSIDYLDGYITLVSARGQEKFNGSTFTLLTAPIDNQIKALTQLNINQSILSQDSAADWGAGTNFMNVSTTTTPGSVAISRSSSTVSELNHNIYQGLVLSGTQPIIRCKLDETFNVGSSTENITIQFGYINGYTVGTYPTLTGGARGDVEISLRNSSSVLIESTTISLTADVEQTVTVPFLSTSMVAGTSYYIYIATTSTFVQGAQSFGFYGAATNTHATDFFLMVGGWVSNSNKLYFEFNKYIKNASHTSQVLTATNWGAWGSFAATKSGGVTYHAQSGGTNPVGASQPWQTVSNGTTISLSSGPYIHVVSSFSITAASESATSNYFSITYTGTNNSVPVLKTYQDSTYLGVLDGDIINNYIYRLNKNGVFEMYDNVYPSAFCTYRGDLLMGSSQSTGQIYKMNIGSTYEDAIGTYTAYYFTPNIDCGLPLTDKIFKSLWVTSSKDTVSYKIDYTLDGSTNTYTLTPTLISTRLNTSRLTLPSATRTGKYIQFKIYSNEYFNIRGMELYYEPKPFVP